MSRMPSEVLADTSVKSVDSLCACVIVLLVSLELKTMQDLPFGQSGIKDRVGSSRHTAVPSQWEHCTHSSLLFAGHFLGCCPPEGEFPRQPGGTAARLPARRASSALQGHLCTAPC